MKMRECEDCGARCPKILMQEGLCPRCGLRREDQRFQSQWERHIREEQLRKQDYAQYPHDEVLAVDFGHELLAQLPRLLSLCHPDKHDNSTKATEVTQWLLTIRARKS